MVKENMFIVKLEDERPARRDGTYDSKVYSGSHRKRRNLVRV